MKARNFWLSLAAILATDLALSMLYSHLTPLGKNGFANTPDEGAHLQYVHFLVTRHSLPVLGRSKHAGYEAHQPPLYYLLCVLPYVVRPSWCRVISILAGMGTILLIALTGRKALPFDPKIGIWAAALTAVIPMHIAINSAVNNDSLNELIFTAVFYLAAVGIVQGFDRRTAFTLGALIGLAEWVKATGLLLYPIGAIAIYLSWRRRPQMRLPIKTWAGVAALSILIALPWWLHCQLVYGAPIPTQRFAQQFAGTAKAEAMIARPIAVDHDSGNLIPSVGGEPLGWPGYIGWVADWTFRSFFAAYGVPGINGHKGPADVGLPTFLPAPFYGLMLGLIVISMIGLVIAHFRRNRLMSTEEISVIHLLAWGLALVMLSFIAFVAVYFQAQGRYLYPAILPISLLLMVGWRQAAGDRYRELLCGGVVGILALVSLVFILSYAAPAAALLKGH
ncbi:MAG: hypothetical protein M1330_03320 [Armatimonadetes bacterium]|nr:hypothetical protein [Armatimonadota bacterium]